MSKPLLFIAAFFLLFSASAQETTPNISFKFAPLGLIVGSGNLQAEYNFGGKHSLTAKIGLPVNVRQVFDFEDQDAAFDLKAMSFLAGYRIYLSKKHFRGLYLEPFFKYVNHSSEGEGSGTLNSNPVRFNFTNEYNAAGIGAQLGAQFLINKHFVIDLFFFGPEINSARNNFKASEQTRTLPWTSAEAREAENDIRNFLDQFPFVRNNTNVMIDQNNRIVTATFQGALPGIRTGFSIGYAF